MGGWVESRIRLISAEAEAEALLGLAELGNITIKTRDTICPGGNWKSLNSGISQNPIQATLKENSSSSKEDWSETNVRLQTRKGGLWFFQRICMGGSREDWGPRRL